MVESFNGDAVAFACVGILVLLLALCQHGRET